MTRIQKAFFEQIELEEEDVKRDFLTSYVYGLLDEEEKKPVQRAVDMLNDEWELDPEATPAILQPWIEDEEAIRLAKLRVEAEIRKENAIQKFRAQREAGATFMESVKAAGEDAGYMTHVLKQANMFELSPERLKILRQARREEYRAKTIFIIF